MPFEDSQINLKEDFVCCTSSGLKNKIILTVLKLKICWLKNKHFYNNNNNNNKCTVDIFNIDPQLPLFYNSNIHSKPESVDFPLNETVVGHSTEVSVKN